MTDPNDITHEPAPSDAPSGFPRWLRWALIGALAVLVVGYGVIFLYAKVINDSPDSFGQGDLDARLDGDTSSSAADADLSTGDTTSVAEPTRPPDSTGTTQPAPGTTSTGGTDSAIGDWTVTDGSEVGYRVQEVLFGVDTSAVGRTDQVEGTLSIEGTQLSAAAFSVDVASISSDDRRRDNQFSGRIMTADEFPTATFALTEPIELGVEAADGATVEASATGDLTLRGVTNSVTFELSAKQEDGRIGVLGSIPVVFADYQIANPSIGGITTEDNGELEFVLVFEPA